MAKGKHKSVPKELKRNIAWLEKEGVKVVLGICECARHKFSPGTIRLVRETDAGFKAIAYSGNGIMNMFIVTKNKTVRELVRNRFNDED